MDSVDHSVVCSFSHSVGGQSFIVDVLLNACHIPRTTKVGWCGAWLRAGNDAQCSSEHAAWGAAQLTAWNLHCVGSWRDSLD